MIQRLTGFVAAGLISSLYQLVTAEPARFRLFGASAWAWLLSFLFFGLTGPFIIMRNAVEARRKERSAVGWLFGSLLIASLWSVCSGLVVLHLALSARYGWS